MKFREFHKNIKLRIAENFASNLISGMIFPFMTIYLARHFGAGKAGMLLLINVAVGIAISFMGGYISDQYGRKKIILAAETLRFAAFFMMMVSNSPWLESPVLTFCMMTVNSICWGLSGPANQAMLLDVSTPEQRKLMYSISYWANNLSIAIGGIAGGFLFKSYLFELFAALTAASAGVVILIAFFIDESYTPTIKTTTPGEHLRRLFTGYASVWKDKQFILFVLAGVLIFSMEMQLTNYVGIRMEREMGEQHFLWWKIDGIQMMGFLRTENTLLVVMLALFVAEIKRVKDRTVLIGSCLLFTAGYGVLSYTNEVPILLFFMLILTIGEVTRVPVEQSYLASIPPDHARSTYMAVNGLKYNLALTIASLTVTLGSILPVWAMSTLITAIGLTGTLIFAAVTPGIERRNELKKVEKAV